MAAEFEKRYFEAHAQCQSDPASCMSEEEFRRIKRRENVEFSDSFARHAVCMIHKLGFLNSKGKLEKNIMKQAIEWNYKDPAKVIAILNECYSDKNTREETALSFVRCFRENGVRLTDIEQK